MIDNYTHIVLVSDRSGSMEAIKTDAQGGINSFVQENKAFEGGIATFSLYDFDTEYRRVFGPDDIKKFESYKLEPRGGTALYDAVGRAVAETNSWLNGVPEPLRPSKVVFVIVTDGEENSSREYNREKVKNVIEASKEKGWEFVFLAANQDAMMAGGAIGIHNNTGYVANAASARGVYASMTNSIMEYRLGGTMTVANNVDAEGNVS